MKFRTLIIIPVGWMLLYLTLSLIFYHQPGATKLLQILQSPISEMLWLTGCLAAALKFEKGEYLRRAWLFFGACPFLFLWYELGPLVTYFAPSIGYEVEIAQGSLAVLANILAVIGTVMFARAWLVAGLELPGSKQIRFVIRIAAFSIAIAAAGPGAYHAFRSALAGQDMAMSLLGVGSAFGDIVSLGMIAPLLLTALALRGGLLSWPWIFFTASLGGWLFYDFSITIAPTMNFAPQTLDILFGATQNISSGLDFSAGMAQCLVVDSILQNGGV